MSKRIVKNSIMIILIIALCVAMYFTVRPRNMMFNTNREEMMQKMQEEGNIPEDIENRQTVNSEMPEDMENMKKENGEMSEEIENAIKENGEIPEDIGNTIKEDGEISEETENKRREIPEGEERENMQRNIPENIRGNLGRMNSTTILLCVAEALGISILTIYLILSKFNKLTLKETFENKSKMISFIILVVLVTAIITVLVMLVNKNSRGNFGGARNGMMPFEESLEQ